MLSALTLLCCILQSSRSSYSHYTASFEMTGAAETRSDKARLTAKEKGKGERKRPAPMTHADAGIGEDEDVVDTTERQFTRNTRQRRREQTSEVSQSQIHEA